MESSLRNSNQASPATAEVRPIRAFTAIDFANQWRAFLLALVGTDMLMIGVAFRLAYIVRFELTLPFFQTHIEAQYPFYQGLSLALVLFWTLIFALNGLYARSNLLGGTQEYSLVFRAVTIGILSVIVIGFLEPTFILARGWLLLAWWLSFMLVSTGRFALRRVVYALRRRGFMLTPAILIGVNSEAKSLAQQLVSWHSSGLDMIGCVDNKLERDMPAFSSLRVLGNLSDLKELIAEHGVTELILATSALSRDDIVAIFRQFGFDSGLNLRLSSGLFEIVTTGVEVKEVGSVPLVRINPLRLKGFDRFLKFMIDIVITIPLLIFLLPIMLAIGLAVRFDSPGPIVHRRRVMGLHGRQFYAYKFRSMHPNGDEILADYPELQAEFLVNQKLVEDPRVTSVGRWLRKYSLDELPQLLNVLKGEMSLVGPRIISSEEMPRYDEWGTNLLTVLPGITGLWQVSGRSDLSFAERVQLDMHYVRNWTIWLDLQILLQTVPAVIKSKGAY